MSKEETMIPGRLLMRGTKLVPFVSFFGGTSTRFEPFCTLRHPMPIASCGDDDSPNLVAERFKVRRSFFFVPFVPRIMTVGK